MTPRGFEARFARTSTIVVVLALLAVGCSDDEPPLSGPPTPPPSGEVSPEAGPGVGRDDPALDVALSEPVEDSYYPDMGDPGVDALHYDLALSWAPKKQILSGVATVVLRATADADSFQLALGQPLEVSAVTVDGDPATFEHQDSTLRVTRAVSADERFALEVHYAGTPEPVDAPTSRNDFDQTGFTITPEGEAWTMQEPYGAYTWYPVNDQPSDKALYDFTLTVPSPWTGIANGELVDRTESQGRTTTHWHLAEPAASYLTTVAFGDYTSSSNTTQSGLDITYWVPTDEPELADGLEPAAKGLDWLEGILGPYPFDTLGFVLVDSRSGMETQTMITLGKTDYTTSTAVIVHEMAHQWYGDQVTPNDWRDVWMNEGMAMYLQGMWQAEHDGISIDAQMEIYANYERDDREEAGPPAAYDADDFGNGNIYYGPALMWHELRERVGDETFFRLVRDWPKARDNTSTDREDYLAWIEDQTGLELSGLFDAWLLSTDTPPRG